MPKMETPAERKRRLNKESQQRFRARLGKDLVHVEGGDVPKTIVEQLIDRGLVPPSTNYDFKKLVFPALRDLAEKQLAEK